MSEKLPQHLSDAIHLRIVMANARRISKREYRGRGNWTVAMNIFGLGSSYAYELCRHLGIDPEATEVRL